MYQPHARFFSTEHDVQERQHLRNEECHACHAKSRGVHGVS